MSEVTLEKIDNSLIENFSQTQSESLDIITLYENDLNENKDFNKIYKNFTNEDYIYNKNPEFNCEFEDRFSFGTTQIMFNVINNKIRAVHLFSDSLDQNLINNIKFKLDFYLVNKTFSRQTFSDFHNKIKNFVQYSGELREITEHIIKKLN